MQLVIPSSTLRSKYITNIKTIPIVSVIKDPLNGHSYIVEEKKLNNALSKVALYMCIVYGMKNTGDLDETTRLCYFNLE